MDCHTIRLLILTILLTRSSASWLFSYRPQIHVFEDQTKRLANDLKSYKDVHGQKTAREQQIESLRILLDLYEDLGMEISSLKDAAVKIEKEIGRVEVGMSSKIKMMDTFLSKVDEIENFAEICSGKHQQLLDGQSGALESLKTFEIRDTLKKLSEFGKKQQEEPTKHQKHFSA